MKASNNRTTIETTLGELVEAASDVAFEYCQNPKEAYALASLVVVEMLKKRFSPAENYIDTFEDGGVGKSFLN